MDVNKNMKKPMYSNKPVIETDSEPFKTTTQNYERRIDQLEDRVRQLSEQVHKLASALQLNSRQMRRANTDITNITTVLRNR